ncbi:centromere protein J isoform X1 [Apteryx mantelli]|uniref:Centrosomal P4.1-associated protein n=1 Tax=Apteryx mantelli TaxID=2696672 RepID=A0A8B7K2Z2_9AVES|nr:PREDICTED: centromere protein J isoform X1 [Apteryx mantelli mantelli]XP_013817658.1 PREDICTED: centromere protein J isoform X1 [Apteryx mantelli mantelli]
MPTVEDLSSEPNFIAHWMSDTSRAGVLLDPNFPGLKINKESPLSGHENITAFPVEVLYLSSSCSISEDSLCEEQILESSSSCRLQQHTTETSFPAAAYNLEASKTEFVHGEVDGQNKSDYNDPLLQKLEQLKELQQQKQEQLKKQQMEQLQRLMEEQQKLLSMVSGQTAVLGSALVAEGQNLRYEHSLGLTALHQFPSSVYQNHNEDRAFALDNVSSHTRDSGFLQKLNNKECISSLKSSLSAVSACEKQCRGVPLKMQNCLKNNEEDKYTTGKNMWCPEQKMEKSVESKDCHIDHACVGSADFSENSGAEKQLWVTNTEERPIKAGIQEKKQTFEEFLEEQIQLEEQRLKQNQELQETSRSTVQKPVIKQPFLKRGEGLTRFTNAKSKITKLGENKPQQSASEDRNVRVDRSQIQKKTVPPGEELVSENPFAPCKKYKQSDKAKHGPIQKTLVLRNQNGKNIFPLETRVQTGKNLDGQMRDSFPSEINNKIENKENIMEFAKSVNTGSRIRNKLPDTEKPQLSHELTSAFSNSKCSVSHSVKGPELSFEVSFQNKLEHWEKEKEKENLELDEFLFLEQAADEISFSSNSSFVQRILDQDQQTLKGRRMSSTPIKAKQKQVNALAFTLKNKKNKKASSDTQGNKNDRAVMHTVSTSGTAFRLKDQFNKTDSILFSASSMTAAPALKSTQWIVNEDKDEGNSDITTDSEKESETTLKCESEDANTSFMSHRESDPEFFGYGGSVTDISREKKNGDADLDLSDKDCSALSKQSKASDHQRSMSCINRSKFEFDDERTWSDLDENYVQNDLPEKYTTKMPLQTEFSCKNDTFVPDKTIKRKVASKRGDELSKQPAVDGDSNGPPVSNLMMKLFPSLKPKQKTGCHSEHEIKSNVEQEPGGNTVPSQILKERLTELETEIERFRAENATLTRLREEREYALANLRKEIADFQQQKAQELAEIEEYKKKEMKKLQKERKVFEKYTTEARAIPDKKERDEIQALKQQIAELQEDIKQKETKWLTTQRRLRDQIEALVNENLELKEEVKIMERFRLEAWKKVEAAGNKRKIENFGIKRAESVRLPNRGQKSQTPSPLLPAQKCSKISGKSYSWAKGRLSRIPKSAPANDRNNSDETVVAPEDASRTFMEDTSPNETLVSVPSVPAYTGSEEIQKEIAYPDGKVEKVLKNGCHLIFFPNGTWKKVSSDGKTITITFFNGDVKQVMPDQTVIYYYADAKTTHTTYSDGLEVLQFSNGQIEKHYPDGRKEITFPDQTIKNLFLDGQEESIFPDGTIVRVQRDGSKTIEFNNGQRELHTSQFKRREYPDGTVKTVYMNGHQETKYVSGRVRVKDKDGNIIMDTKL